MSGRRGGGSAGRNEYGRPPSRVLYTISARLIRLAARCVYHVSWSADPAIFRLEKPVIVIANHPSYYDPFFAGAVLCPLRVNFLAADNFFRSPILRALLRRIGAIPKIQFRPDPRAMKAMIGVIRRGGVLGIFPEGTRSVHGRRMPIEESFTKFIRRMGASVVYVNSQGAYLTWPRWSKSGVRKGRIRITAGVLATGGEIAGMSLPELHAKITSALDFDDYAMQKVHPVRYRSGAPALGLESILHQCPRCGAMWAMRSMPHTLYCSACGNGAVMDDYGMLAPRDPSCVVFETPGEWHDWQLDRLQPLAAGDGFILEDRAVMQRSAAEAPFADVARGVIRLTAGAFEFFPDGSAGTDRTPGTAGPGGAAEAEPVRFPISGIWGISADYGANFDLYGEKDTYRFLLENGQKAITFSNALDLLRGGA